jgi:hypothetical protein
MLRITAITVTCVFCTVGAAFAEIEVWAGGDIIPPPTIDHDENTIEIEAAGTYGFRAWDGDAALEEIQSITVDSGRVAHPSRSEGWGRDFLPERPSCRSTITPVSGNLATIAAWRRA